MRLDLPHQKVPQIASGFPYLNRPQTRNGQIGTTPEAEAERDAVSLTSKKAANKIRQHSQSEHQKHVLDLQVQPRHPLMKIAMYLRTRVPWIDPLLTPLVPC